MGGYIRSNVSRVETTALNTKVNKEVFDDFKDTCKVLGYPMNVVLEIFMNQYSSGRIKFSDENVWKWKENKEDKNKYKTDTLSTTFNKEIYQNFKFKCKADGYFVKHVIMAFMKKFSNGELMMEFVEVEIEE